MFFPDEYNFTNRIRQCMLHAHPTVPTTHDDDPFIVLTETKFSFRCIPVWIGTLLTGLGSKKTHVIMFSP